MKETFLIILAGIEDSLLQLVLGGQFLVILVSCIKCWDKVEESVSF